MKVPEMSTHKWKCKVLLSFFFISSISNFTLVFFPLNKIISLEITLLVKNMFQFVLILSSYFYCYVSYDIIKIISKEENYYLKIKYFLIIVMGIQIISCKIIIF
jgi:hypothetical protein